MQQNDRNTQTFEKTTECGMVLLPLTKKKRAEYNQAEVRALQRKNARRR